MIPLESGDVYKNVTDFEISAEVKFAILNKIDRVWDYYPEDKFLGLICKILNVDSIQGSSASNTELTRILDKYIEENNIK
jgi:hypothetical protein